jgi:hypothetical protein
MEGGWRVLKRYRRTIGIEGWCSQAQGGPLEIFRVASYTQPTARIPLATYNAAVVWIVNIDAERVP